MLLSNEEYEHSNYHYAEYQYTMSYVPVSYYHNCLHFQFSHSSNEECMVTCGCNTNSYAIIIIVSSLRAWDKPLEVALECFVALLSMIITT